MCLLRGPGHGVITAPIQIQHVYQEQFSDQWEVVEELHEFLWHVVCTLYCDFHVLSSITYTHCSTVGISTKY